MTITKGVNAFNWFFITRCFSLLIISSVVSQLMGHGDTGLTGLSAVPAATLDNNFVGGHVTIPHRSMAEYTAQAKGRETGCAFYYFAPVS